MDSKNIVTGVIVIAILAAISWVLVGGDNQPDEDSDLGRGTRFPNGISADSTSPSAGQVRGTTLEATGASTLTGLVTEAAGFLSQASSTVDGAFTITGETLLLENSTSTDFDGNTLTLAQSFTTTYLEGAAATTTLPAVGTATSSVYRFVVAASITGDIHVASAEGDNIEGSLIVAGAVVNCDAVDRIDIIADGENLGDFFELRSDGQNWFVTQSNALTAAKLTCTEGI